MFTKVSSYDGKKQEAQQKFIRVTEWKSMVIFVTLEIY